MTKGHHLIGAAVMLALVAATAVQAQMPLPPSVAGEGAASGEAATQRPARSAKPKARAARTGAAARPSRARAEEERKGVTRDDLPTRRLSRDDDPSAGSGVRPTLTPGGGMGLGGRF